MPTRGRTTRPKTARYYRGWVPPTQRVPRYGVTGQPATTAAPPYLPVTMRQPWGFRPTAVGVPPMQAQQGLEPLPWAPGYPRTDISTEPAPYSTTPEIQAAAAAAQQLQQAYAAATQAQTGAQAQPTPGGQVGTTPQPTQAGAQGAGGGAPQGYTGTNEMWAKAASAWPQWYSAFQAEHGGTKPEEFYGAQGEGAAEAVADKEWAEAFYRANGRAPNDAEWRAHWFDTRAPWFEGAYGGGGGQQPEEPRPPLWIPPSLIWNV